MSLHFHQLKWKIKIVMKAVFFYMKIIIRQVNESNSENDAL